MGRNVLRKRACVVRRGAGGKGLLEYLACGLPDFVLGFTGPKAEAEEIKQQRRHVLARRTQARTL